jgi:hypothetical protein
MWAHQRAIAAASAVLAIVLAAGLFLTLRCDEGGNSGRLPARPDGIDVSARSGNEIARPAREPERWMPGPGKRRPGGSGRRPDGTEPR